MQKDCLEQSLPTDNMLISSGAMPFGYCALRFWIPAFAGMTATLLEGMCLISRIRQFPINQKLIQIETVDIAFKFKYHIL